MRALILASLAGLVGATLGVWGSNLLSSGHQSTYFEANDIENYFLRNPGATDIRNNLSIVVTPNWKTACFLGPGSDVISLMDKELGKGKWSVKSGRVVNEGALDYLFKIVLHDGHSAVYVMNFDERLYRFFTPSNCHLVTDLVISHTSEELNHDPDGYGDHLTTYRVELKVTPGHATLCGDGRFDGQHVPILDILRSDGALVREDGTKIRAGTGCRLGTMGDRMITAIIGEQQMGGLVRIAEVGQIRAGTRFITEDGEDVSVLDMIQNSGGRLTEDGMIQTSANGPKMPFRWTFTSSLPKPEDYVLQRSATHLQDIYQANEWESVRPSMPIPMGGEAGATISKHPAIVAAAPVNVPLALRNRPDAPQMSRKYRGAAEAKARKKGGMVH